MPGITDSECAAVCETFERLMADGSDEPAVRAAMASELGHDPALWRQCAQLGFAGLLVPGDYGGIGAGARELEQIMERAGAALACLPLLSSAVLAVGAVAGSDDAAAKQRLLPGLADGSVIGTVALTGAAGLWSEAGIDVTARRDGDRWRLDGGAAFVTDAVAAGLMLAVARTDAGEIGIFEVEAIGSVAIEPVQTIDRTQRLANVRFDGVAARKLEGAGGALLAEVLALARVALAGRQTGAARRIFEITIEYLKTRVQFGRPIGGFQAMKHMAADLLLEVESATSAARAAAEALDSNADDAAELVALAAFACGDAFVRIAADAIQMHGGIGFTWEHSAHLFMRRARGDRMLFGTPDAAREDYLRILERAG